MADECGKGLAAMLVFILSLIFVAVEAVEMWARDRQCGQAVGKR